MVYVMTFTHLLLSRLISLLNPVISTMALFVPMRNFRALPILVAVGTLLHGYVIALAFLSPNPPLAGTTAGTILTVSPLSLSYIYNVSL